MSLKRFIKQSSIPYMSADEMVKEAIGRMIDSGSGVVLVTDAEGALKGIVSERDVMTRVAGEDRDPKTTTIATIMTTEVVTAPLVPFFEPKDVSSRPDSTGTSANDQV